MCKNTFALSRLKGCGANAETLEDRTASKLKSIEMEARRRLLVPTLVTNAYSAVIVLYPESRGCGTLSAWSAEGGGAW